MATADSGNDPHSTSRCDTRLEILCENNRQPARAGRRCGTFLGRGTEMPDAYSRSRAARDLTLPPLIINRRQPIQESGGFSRTTKEASSSVTIRRVSGAADSEDTERWMSIHVPDCTKLARMCVLEPDFVAIPYVIVRQTPCCFSCTDKGSPNPFFLSSAISLVQESLNSTRSADSNHPDTMAPELSPNLK